MDLGIEMMAERAEMLEAALDSRSEGIVLLGLESEVVFWNRAAEAITGYNGLKMLFLPVPDPLEPLLEGPALHSSDSSFEHAPARGVLVKLRHKLGHCVQVIAQRTTLRDGSGESIGTAVFFHPAQSLDALPHGETSEADVEGSLASQEDLQERLQAEYNDFTSGGPPFGVLWISVDQAEELRKTHGIAACHAMFDKVRQALAQGLRPAERIGLWGEAEFLVVAHERSAEMLAAHAQTLAGMARTADFRWWGDRISLTVSIGAAQAKDVTDEGLAQLLDRARQAMECSNHEGGNRAMLSPGRPGCSRS